MARKCVHQYVDTINTLHGAQCVDTFVYVPYPCRAINRATMVRICSIYSFRRIMSEILWDRCTNIMTHIPLWYVGYPFLLRAIYGDSRDIWPEMMLHTINVPILWHIYVPRTEYGTDLCTEERKSTEKTLQKIDVPTIWHIYYFCTCLLFCVVNISVNIENPMEGEKRI